VFIQEREELRALRREIRCREREKLREKYVYGKERKKEK
jgi:hypothetical protein